MKRLPHLNSVTAHGWERENTMRCGQEWENYLRRSVPLQLDSIARDSENDRRPHEDLIDSRNPHLRCEMHALSPLQEH